MAARLASSGSGRQLAARTSRNYRMIMRLILPLAISVLLLACHERGHQQQSSMQAEPPPGDGIKGVHTQDKGKPEPSAQFYGPDGKALTLADFKGKPVLVNLWATWCAPCVKELPTLDQLSRSGKVQVIAVSQDTAPRASVVAFLAAHRITALKPYQDPKMTLSGELGPDTVLPTSILLDSSGKEVWRYVGDLDWTSPQAASLLAEAGAGPARSEAAGRR